MLGFLVFCALSTFGPQLDLLDGAAVTQKEARLLPASPNVGAVADVWFLSLVNSWPSGGHVSTLDSRALSSHGWSWTQMRYAINGLDVTDPARPGNPLVEVPHDVWQRLSYHALWSEAPRLEWTVELAPARLGVDARAGFVAAVGGGTWIPRGLMDREPALAFGADPVRREVDYGYDIVADTRSTALRFSVEHIQHARQYPTLVEPSGQLLLDEGRRTTILSGGRYSLLDVPIRLLAIWQTKGRSHAGAEYRHPRPLTRELDSSALHAQAQAELRPSNHLKLDAGLGFGWASERADLRTKTPPLRDIEEEWLWMHRAFPSTDNRRVRLDAELAASVGKLHQTWITLTGSRAWIRDHQTLPENTTATTFLRATEPASRSVSMTTFATMEPVVEQLQHARLEALTTPKLGGVHWRFLAALDYAGAAPEAGRRLDLVSPALGLAASKKIGDGELFVLLRREPLDLTAEVVEFIDRARASGEISRWDDDGDLVPQPEERGAVLRRTGGDAHRIAPHLSRPSSNSLAVGWRTPRFGPFRAILTSSARALLERFTVRLRGPAAESYGESTVGEQAHPGDPVFGIDEDLPAFPRVPGTEGQELYELGNASRNNVYLGAEIQLVTDHDRPWFINLAAAGYWSLGNTPFGIFADRNDSGIISETSADPNHRVNQYGSVDSGRAFSINLLTGMQPWRGFSTALALRYRDGEPLTRFIVLEDIPQGPTALMAVARGDPVPRFTFHMTIDWRLRYEWDVGPFNVTSLVDVYNLLGSGTEILEDVRTGPSFRQSLEMMPPRTLMLKLAGRWP